MPEIVAVRLAPSEDGSHEHVVLLGYASDHLRTGEDHAPEPIMVPPQRIQDKKVLGESFWVAVNGERADIVPGVCPVCRVEAYPRTSADDDRTEHLRELPRT